MLNFNGKKRIAGIGSALVDMLLQESDDFVAATGAAKGGMTLVENSAIDAMLSKTNRQPSVVPGGSACNTIIGAGNLGGPARFIGKKGDDEFGTTFANGLSANKVEGILTNGTLPTGRVVSVITPDAQRSMFTYLGASQQLTIEEITPVLFEDTAVVHLEGYLLFNHDIMRAALTAAHQAGAKISLDCASFQVIELNRDMFSEIVKTGIDIIIANEDEARALTGLSDEEKALVEIKKMAPVAVVKMGKRGSLIATDEHTVRIGIKGDGRAVDTTGAGDLWAAGFLYGIVNGFSLEKAGELGAACGFEVCQVIGAVIPEAGWKRIRALLG